MKRLLVLAALMAAGCGSGASPAATASLTPSAIAASGTVNFRVDNGTAAIYVEADNATLGTAVLASLKKQAGTVTTQVSSLPAGSEMTCGNADDTITVWDTGGNSQTAAQAFCSAAGYS